MRRATAWVAALLVLMAFAFQGTRGIWEPDEGRYTAAALNMLDGGDWLVPTLDGERPHLTKPPLTYWTIAASAAALGRDEWAVRLPGALAFVGTGLLLLALGRRLCPARPWLPALVWSLSLAPLVGANIVSTDALLTFFETAAMTAFVEAWAREGAARRPWLVGMWLAFGLAFLTKGPPGLLPLLAMLVFLAAHDRARMRGLFPPEGLAGFALLAFGWFGWLVHQDPSRLGYFLGYEVYGRVFTGVHRRHAEWYGGLEVYLPVLVAGALPWSALAIAAAGGPRGAWQRLRARVAARDRGVLLLLYWFLLPLAVFFLARSRLQLYVLPLFVPLALLIARPLARWPWLEGRRLATVAGVTAVAMLAIKGTLALWPGDRDGRAMGEALRGTLAAEGARHVVFVGMKAFYGLDLYLDVKVESLEVDERVLEYADRVDAAGLCADLAGRRDTLLVLKQSRAPQFRAIAGDCTSVRLEQVGAFDADGNRHLVFATRPAAVTAPGARG